MFVKVLCKLESAVQMPVIKGKQKAAIGIHMALLCTQKIIQWVLLTSSVTKFHTYIISLSFTWLLCSK